MDKSAPAKGSTPKTLLGIAKAVGLVLIVLGIITAAYFVYAWVSFGSRAATFTSRGYYGARFNQSGFNQSGFNYTRAGFNSTTAGARFGGEPVIVNAYFEGVVIGILMLLLGIMTLKYAGAKAPRETKK